MRFIVFDAKGSVYISIHGSWPSFLHGVKERVRSWLGTGGTLGPMHKLQIDLWIRLLILSSCLALFRVSTIVDSFFFCA